MNTSDLIADRLIDWGVDTIFGLPGDGINGMMEALRERSDRIRFVLVRHEEGASFAATGYSKFTGRLGVCLATSGPGGIHLLNGLYDAHEDNVPVLAITGRTYSDLIGSRYQQDVDLLTPFSEVAAFNHLITNASYAEMATDIACRTAISRRDVAHLAIPIDVQVQKFSDKLESEHKVLHATSDVLAPPSVPSDKALAKAAEILDGSKKTVIMVGAGALGATEEVIALSDKLKAPVVKALLGKAVIPDEHPASLGGLGLLGTAPAEEAMEDTDVLLMVGTCYPFGSFLPPKGKAKAIQIDIKGEHIGLHYPVSLPLVGDSRETLRKLIPMLRWNDDDSFLRKAQEKMHDWWKLMEERASRTDYPMRPQAVAWTLSDLLDDDAVICCDSGTITTWAARYIKIRARQAFSLSGRLASMANGLSYAIGAQVAFPSRQVVAFVGDGGFSMLMCEFLTAVAHDLPIKVIVIKNGFLGQIRWEQVGFLGNPEYGVKFQDMDFAKFAEACGGAGVTIDRFEDLRPKLAEALAEKKPTIVQAVVEPNEPPYPARTKLKDVENLTKALARGEPQRKQIALTLFRDKLHEL